MLVMLLIYTLKKGFKESASFDLVLILKKLAHKIKYILPYFLLSNISIDNTIPDVEKISFSIVNNDSKIGYINIQKTSANQITTYSIESEVNTKVIFNFSAVGQEKSIYKDDTLIYSSMYRKLNNKVKLNQSLEFIDGKYVLKNKGKEERIDLESINRNLVTLFFFEPKGFQKVFSDKYSQMVDVTPIGQNKYEVILPNKSSSIYHYKNGRCTKIDVEGSFFKVELMLTP